MPPRAGSQRRALLALLGVNMLVLCMFACLWAGCFYCVSLAGRCVRLPRLCTRLSSRDLSSTVFSLGTCTVLGVCGPGHLQVCVLVANVPRYVVLLPVAGVFTLRLLRAVQL